MTIYEMGVKVFSYTDERRIKGVVISGLYDEFGNPTEKIKAINKRTLEMHSLSMLNVKNLKFIEKQGPYLFFESSFLPGVTLVISERYLNYTYDYAIETDESN